MSPLHSSFWKDEDEYSNLVNDRRSGSPKPGIPKRDIKVPKAMPMRFCLFPLQSKEKRLVIKRSRWSLLTYKPEGDYEVAPIKLDIRDFQRKYWIYRNCRQLFSIGSVEPEALTLSDILWARSTIFKYLGNGTRRQTKEQRSLLSQTYYALRRHNRLQDGGKL